MAEVFTPVRVFCSYVHEDEVWRKKLENHLSLLKRQNFISFWYDRLIAPGTDWSKAIDAHLDAAAVILLLVSSDFLASDYCYGVEMQRAIARHHAGEARVIPILVREVDWKDAPFAHLKILPAGNKPLQSWKKQDKALAEIATDIRSMIENWYLVRRSTPLYLPPLSNTGMSFSNMRTASLPSPHRPANTTRVPLNPPGSVPPTEAQSNPRVPATTTGQSRVSRRTLFILTAGAGATIAAFVAGILVEQNQNQASTGTSQSQPFTYRGHFDVVNAVAWSPSDGQQIASGSADKTVQMWNVSNGSEVFIYTGHTDRVETVAWLPQGGQRIASGSLDKTVQVWDADNGGNAVTYHGHTAKVTAVAWSPDGKRIASASSDGTVQVWDASSGGHLLTYQGHTAKVTSVAWLPQGGQLIASGSADKTVQVWNASNGDHISTYQGHSDEVTAVIWSPNGKQIASGSADKTVRVWDPNEAGDVFIYGKHSGVVNAVAWSPDGTLIASGSDDKTVQVWNPNDEGSVYYIYRGHSGALNAIAWSLDGKQIASGSSDKTVQVWHVG